MPITTSSTLTAVPSELASVSNKPARKVFAAELLMLLIVLIWGVNFVVVKNTLRQMQPLTFNALRFILASSALLCAAKWRGTDMRLTWREARLYCALGFVVATLYQILFIEGIARTTAGNSSLIVAMSPVLIALAGHFMGRERLHRRAAFGVLLAFAGLYFVITGKQSNSALASPTLLGDLLSIAAACTWAFYTLVSQPFLQQRSALRVTAYSISFGTIPLLLWCSPSLLAQSWSQIDVFGWSGLFYSGLLSIALSQLLW
ncbi:MAG: DMT family transporter, partial [candidate division KSB1 bacterium]